MSLLCAFGQKSALPPAAPILPVQLKPAAALLDSIGYEPPLVAASTSVTSGTSTNSLSAADGSLITADLSLSALRNQLITKLGSDLFHRAYGLFKQHSSGKLSPQLIASNFGNSVDTLAAAQIQHLIFMETHLQQQMSRSPRAADAAPSSVTSSSCTLLR